MLLRLRIDNRFISERCGFSRSRAREAAMPIRPQRTSEDEKSKRPSVFKQSIRQTVRAGKRLSVRTRIFCEVPEVAVQGLERASGLVRLCGKLIDQQPSIFSCE